MFVSTWRLREYMRIWSFKETSLLRPSFVQQVSEQLNFSVLSTSQGHLWTSPTGRQDRNENMNQRSSIKVGIGDLVHCQKKKNRFRNSIQSQQLFLKQNPLLRAFVLILSTVGRSSFFRFFFFFRRPRAFQAEVEFGTSHSHAASRHCFKIIYRIVSGPL